MRFLVQECLGSPAGGSGGAEGAVDFAMGGQDPALDARAPGDPDGQPGGASAHKYVHTDWHPSGSVYACSDMDALVSQWQPQVDTSPQDQYHHSHAGLGGAEGAGGTDGARGGLVARPLGTFCTFAAGQAKAGKKAPAPLHATCCGWHPRGDTLAVACSQGSFKLVARNGRLDKSVDAAHEGACIAIRWNLDGTALATSGEDGKVKLWSKTGMLRSVLASEDNAVYAVAFSPDSNLLVLCSGKHIVVKRIGANSSLSKNQVTTGAVIGDHGAEDGGHGGHGAGAGLRSIRWRAHAGVVLCLDWNAANGKLVSGGEDGRYKVWDQYGRLLYQSAVLGHEIALSPGLGGKAGGLGGQSGGQDKGAAGMPVMPVTSVRWRPNGESFAVGTFDLLLLCDESGWVQHKASPAAVEAQVGGAAQGRGGAGKGAAAGKRRKLPCSVVSMAWSADGTQLACANGEGDVFVVMILGEVKERGTLLLETAGASELLASCTLPDELASSTEVERLHFGDEKVVLTSVGFGYLSLVELDAACKLCIGTYAASALVFIGAGGAFLGAGKQGWDDEDVDDDGLALGMQEHGIAFGGGVAFVGIAVGAYVVMSPDFSRYIGECGTLAEPDDPYGVMIPLSSGGITAIEVLDPLCPSCKGLERRLDASGLGDRIGRQALLFPLDNSCNWMVGSAVHPGACTISEAMLCADTAGAQDILHWAFENQENIMAAEKAAAGGAKKLVTGQFPSISKCVGGAKVRSKLNKSLRWAVSNQLPVLTPQLYVAGEKLCDEDTDLGLDYALSRMLERI